MIALVFRPRPDAGQVAAGARLGHRDAEDRFTGDALRQEAALLLLRAEALDVRRHEPGVQREVQAAVAVAQVLLEQDLLVTEIPDAGAAVAFRSLHQQQTLRTALAVDLPIHLALLVPAVPVRLDFLLEEAPHGIAEHVVLGLEDPALHGALRRLLRPAQAAERR